MPDPRSRPRSPVRLSGLLGGVGACAIALALASCGGGSTGNSAGGSSGNASADQMAAAGETSAGAGADGAAAVSSRIATRPNGRPARDPVHSHHRAAHARAPYHGTDDDEVNETGAKASSPCRLVTQSEASAIVGKPIRISLAPQGPTCVYSSRGAKTDITLAVESANLSIIRRQSRNLARVKIHASKGYCVKYGSVMMLVGLHGGRVLNVTAPCPTAARFAAKALARVR